MGSPITQIPYGQLANGKYGVLLDDLATIQPIAGQPLSSVVEIFATLPADGADAENFNGRLVFAVDDQTLYVFQADAGAGEWFPLEGIPAEVGLCTETDAVTGRPRPPVTGTEQTGFLFWCTDAEVMFVWDGDSWEPIGGRFAASTREITHTGDDVSTTFAVGITVAVTTSTEVFLDGVRQHPGTYNLVGTNVEFVTPPATSVAIFIRIQESDFLEGPQLAPNVQCVARDYPDQAAGVTDFDAGFPGLDPECTSVYRDGLLIMGSGVDYVHESQDTTISSITNAGTLATATTASAHSLASGDEIEIDGAAEPEYNGTFTITVTGASTFEYTMSADPGGAATPDPILFYTPPGENDVIVLNVATSLGEDIAIRSFRSIVTSPSVGEANTASNLGAGVGVFSTKVSEDLRFKSLVSGANVTITDLGSTIEIGADGAILFESRSGINTSSYTASSSDSYIGIIGTAITLGVVTINITAEHSPGRRLVITDETGNAGAPFDIQIVATGMTFSGVASPLLIDSAFGSVTVVAGETNEWNVTSKTF